MALLAGCPDDDDDDPDDNDVEEVEIDPDDDVVLDGYQSHWEGIEPADIEEAENPTLVLEDGEEYTFEWINADGIEHNLEIRDEGDEILEETDSIDEEGDGDDVTFTAESEMVTYICTYHEATQVGDLVVE